MQTYKDLTLNDKEKLCYIGEQEILLTPNEYNLLLFLLENRNTIFSREELLEKVYKREITERSIDLNIKRLRDKLEDYRYNIITRRGFGYGFKE